MRNILIICTSAVLLLSSCWGNGRPNPAKIGQSETLNDVSVEYVDVVNNESDMQSTMSTATPCVFNVYVENSGSMDGYVNGVTDFENSVYSYLSDIQNSDICSKMNLFYINSEMHEFRADVKDFIQKLDPASFKQRGGNRGTTDISNLLGTILKMHGKDTVSILISDFVFSPGRGMNAEEFLINQQVGIKNHIVRKRKNNPDLAFIIYRLSSNFDGIYYDQNDTKYNINHERPFYIMMFGDQEDLNQLSKNVSKTDVKGSGVLNTYTLSTSGCRVPYSVVMSPRIGSFKSDHNAPKTSIVKAKIDKNAPGYKFICSIGVDFSNQLLDDDYLMNPENYKVSNPAYVLEIEKSKNPKYTHALKLCLNPKLKQISRGNITISLLKQPSDWAAVYTNIDDTSEEKITTDKTYGLKYLIDGVYEGFGKDNIYTEINININ